MRKANRLTVTPGGYVFRDLGLAAYELEHLLLRADLLIQLQRVITTRGQTLAKAATILCVTQSADRRAWRLWRQRQ